MAGVDSVVEFVRTAFGIGAGVFGFALDGGVGVGIVVEFAGLLISSAVV